MVVFNEGTLAFENGNIYGRLLVSVGRKYLCLLRGDNRSAIDDLLHQAPNSLNTQRERGNIDQQDILGLISGLTTQDAALYSGSVSDSFVGVDAAVGLLTVEEVRHEGLNFGDTGGTADKDNIIDLGLLQSGIVKDLLQRLECFLEQVEAEFLKARTGHDLFEVDAVN